MHRDLKPANILLTLDGTVKVGDLGLSRELSENTYQAHSKVGTPLYMSPEVLRGDGYDFKSDIWSIGCLLYELAMLKSPFKSDGLNMFSLFQKISQGEYSPLPDKYSEELRNLAYAMISTNPVDRPEIGEICEISRAMRQKWNEEYAKEKKLQNSQKINNNTNNSTNNNTNNNNSNTANNSNNNNSIVAVDNSNNNNHNNYQNNQNSNHINDPKSNNNIYKSNHKSNNDEEDDNENEGDNNNNYNNNNSSINSKRNDVNSYNNRNNNNNEVTNSNPQQKINSEFIQNNESKSTYNNTSTNNKRSATKNHIADFDENPEDNYLNEERDPQISKSKKDEFNKNNNQQQRPPRESNHNGSISRQQKLSYGGDSDDSEATQDLKLQQQQQHNNNNNNNNNNKISTPPRKGLSMAEDEKGKSNKERNRSPNDINEDIPNKTWSQKNASYNDNYNSNNNNNNRQQQPTISKEKHQDKLVAKPKFPPPRTESSDKEFVPYTPNQGIEVTSVPQSSHIAQPVYRRVREKSEPVVNNLKSNNDIPEMTINFSKLDQTSRNIAALEGIGGNMALMEMIYSKLLILGYPLYSDNQTNNNEASSPKESSEYRRCKICSLHFVCDLALLYGNKNLMIFPSTQFGSFVEVTLWLMEQASPLQLFPELNIDHDSPPMITKSLLNLAKVNIYYNIFFINLLFFFRIVEFLHQFLLILHLLV